MERTKKNNSPAILVADPSLTAFGWAVLRNHTVVDSGCIQTKPEAKKRRIREGDDRTRRTHEIAWYLYQACKRYNVCFIAAELPHGSQSARAAIMMGITTGIIQTLATCLEIPLEWYSEGDAKKALLGRNSAAKDEMIREIEQTFEMLLTGPKYAREAIADALAIYNVAQINSPTLKILLR